LSFFTKIFNQAGVSLPEILVGAGILAGVSLAGSKLMQDQKVAQKRVEHDQKLADYHQALVRTLSSAGNCNATLRNFYNLNIISGSVPVLRRCTSGCNEVRNRNTSYDASSVTGSVAIITPGASSFTDDTQNWAMTQVVVDSTSSVTRSGRLVLKATYRHKISNKSIIKDIPLNVRFDGGLFKECLNAEENSVVNLQNDLCKTMNLVNSSGTIETTAGLWNESTQNCQVQITKTCGVGMQYAGVDSTGRLRCQPVVKDNDVNALQNNNAMSCPAPQRPSLQYDYSTQRMVIRCM
jgi:hypothetical protein